MGEFITNIFNAFLELMRQFRAVDVLDIVVVAFLIYSLIKLVRETRAEQLVKGLLIMIIAWALSSQLNLKMIKTLLDNFFQFGIIALLVVFQPELRRALEHIGRTKIGTRDVYKRQHLWLCSMALRLRKKLLIFLNPHWKTSVLRIWAR